MPGICGVVRAGIGRAKATGPSRFWIRFVQGVDLSAANDRCQCLILDTEPPCIASTNAVRVILWKMRESVMCSHEA